MPWKGKLKQKKSPVFVLLLLFMICVTLQPSKRMAYICILMWRFYNVVRFVRTGIIFTVIYYFMLITVRLMEKYIQVSQEDWIKLRESVPYVKLYRYNPKHLYPKLNGYGDNGQRIVWSSCGFHVLYLATCA